MPTTPKIEVVGAGRMGSALVRALRAAGHEVPAPGGRGAACEGADIVLLAVPDAALADAARSIAPGRMVGHLSGATSLDPLAPHERFSLHPLISIIAAEPGEADASDGSDAASPFAGVPAAVAGSSARAIEAAEDLARALGLRAFRVAEEDRVAYHAAASVASNFLVALEWFAEELAGSAGVGREALVPLVSATVRNWAVVGAERALTGPIARGDAATVERQRAAVAERLPERLALFDELASATRSLAGRSPAERSLADRRLADRSPEASGAEDL
ncbi:MAG: DUF2520 domain-containing protein [Leucobacter sp.]|jgi:predicted short-subunit dehydrogenase-like oxidoreductase (DUF2520 family)